MIKLELEQELHKHLDQLSIEDQQEVLVYVKTLTTRAPTGVPGTSLLKFSGYVPEKELTQMAKAIEQVCEQVNINGW